MTLRSRLAWTYGAAVFVAVMLLAIISLVAIDRSLRTSLDSRLTTAASAGTSLVDVHHGQLKIDPEDAKDLLAALPSDMQVAVVSSEGRVYTASSSRLPDGIFHDRPSGDASIRLYTVGTSPAKLRVAVVPVVRGGVSYGAIAVWEGSDYIDEFDRNAILAIGFGALLIGGVVVILSSTVARRALAPLERFTELATEIEAHDLSRRIGSRSNDELGKLASAFDRMLDRLQSAFGRQRRFTADASHELRAPLAVIRAEADVALDRERSPEQYRAALKTIVEEVDRMDALVDGLLAAARADSAALRRERLDIAELVVPTVARFAQAAAARRIAVETTLVDAAAVGDAQALERALAAIIHNAIEFAERAVRVTAAVNDGEIVVSVHDDGPGFSAEGLAHASERFWRGDPARRRGGTGLGLSIADAIVRAHGGSLSLSNAAAGGAVVEVRLPFIVESSEAGTISL